MGVWILRFLWIHQMSLMNLERIKFSKMLEKWVNRPITFTSFYVTMSLVGWNCNIYNHPKNSKCGPFVKITTFLLADILLLYFNNKACLYKDLFRFKRAQKKYNQIGQRKNIIESTKAVLLYLLYLIQKIGDFQGPLWSWKLLGVYLLLNFIFLFSKI